MAVQEHCITLLYYADQEEIYIMRNESMRKCLFAKTKGAFSHGHQVLA